MNLSVLVVEDDNIKLQALLAALGELGIDAAKVERCADIVSAKRRLAETQYDILILDVMLPQRHGDRPMRDGGRQLMRELLQRDHYKKPRQIIGLTAYSELHEQFSNEGEEDIWTLLYYDRSSDEWLKRIAAILKFVGSSTGRDVHTGVREIDAVIVTAVQKELRQVRKLPWNWGDAVALDEATFAYEGRFLSAGEWCSVATACASKMGMVAAAILSHKLILAYRPRILVMAGICAGIEGRVRMGDPVMGEVVWDAQSGKLLGQEGRETFLQDPYQYQASLALVERFRQIWERPGHWADVHSEYEGAKPEHVPAGVIGAMASVSAVHASVDAILKVRAQNRSLMALEMESYGVYAAASTVGKPRPLVAAIKSVCDFGDATKNDKFQDYAAYTSARSVQYLLEAHAANLRRA